MGESSDFTCEHCGYTSHVSRGRDCGMEIVIEPRVCGNCCSLSNILIEHYLMDDDPIKAEFDKDIGRCRACGSSETHLWPASHPCPKCGGQMQQYPDGISSMWD